MAWPSTSNENNVDSAGASLTDARAQVYQHLSNINDIIDTFDIPSPNEGDVLIYNGSSGKFESAAASDIQVTANMAILKLDENGYTEIFDNNNLVNVASDNQSFTFNEDGNYFLEFNGHMAFHATPALQPGDFFGITARQVSGSNAFKHFGPKIQLLENNYVTQGYFETGDSTANYVSRIGVELPSYPSIVGYDPGRRFGTTFFVRIQKQ